MHARTHARKHAPGMVRGNLSFSMRCPSLADHGSTLCEYAPSSPLRRFFFLHPAVAQLASRARLGLGKDLRYRTYSCVRARACIDYHLLVVDFIFVYLLVWAWREPD